jgi:hypothetical protein
VFLKLGSEKACQRFRETKMRDGERVLLAVPKFVCTIVNERTILIMGVLSVILKHCSVCMMCTILIF